jgi:type IV pilus assembly protein PilB
MAADKRLLGDYLIEAGLIGQAELDKALEVQKASGHRLGEVLVALGFLTETDVARAVAGQLGIPYVHDHELQVDMTVARLLPPSVARKTNALPLREESGLLYVAIPTRWMCSLWMKSAT